MTPQPWGFSHFLNKLGSKTAIFSRTHSTCPTPPIPHYLLSLSTSLLPLPEPKPPPRRWLQQSLYPGDKPLYTPLRYLPEPQDKYVHADVNCQKPLTINQCHCHKFTDYRVAVCNPTWITSQTLGRRERKKLFLGENSPCLNVCPHRTSDASELLTHL